MRIAIVGTGIAGLGCAHFLQRKCDLTIFEQEERPGGHSRTVTVDEDGTPVNVDTGFMVFNHRTYPCLTRLFRELGVETVATDMSFSVQNLPKGLEYNGGSLNLLFGQRRNLLRPNHWRMLSQIDRFNREAVAALEDDEYASVSLGEYVERRGYGQAMRDDYLVPMASAVWSSPPDLMLDFPARTLLRFWHNHGFLGLNTQLQWHTVRGGARAYVDKLVAPFRDRLLLGRPATRIARINGQVVISSEGAEPECFDKVILASHPDQSLRLLADPTALEMSLLGKFRYQPNTVTLHTDARFMPRRRRCWASWNYRIDQAADGSPAPTTHYWMNRLQGVSTRVDYFVSMNCHERIDPARILRRIDFEHPLFNRAAVAAQAQLQDLNRFSPGQTTFYAGAWFRHGFHEDGLVSAIDCVRTLTGHDPWP